MSSNTFASSVNFFALTNLDVRFHINSATQHGLLLLVLEFDGFLLYCPELALLLCIPCQNLLKVFNVTLSLTFNLVKHCKYFIAARFTIYMYILLSDISFHCNTFVKLSVFSILHSSNCRKSFSLLSLFIYTHYGSHVLF